MDAIEFSLFVQRITAICEEMGSVLKCTAFSPNIKERQDYSCAIFNHHGQLCTQAANIPVHLGSMAYAMSSIVEDISWQQGDMLILNDPYRGGTHLPDVTVIAPVFFKGVLCAFVANRAHHADIGASTPGSMPIARSIEEEGLIISPLKIMQNNRVCISEMDRILDRLHDRNSANADFHAQFSANLTGSIRLAELVRQMQADEFISGLDRVQDYAATLADTALLAIPEGHYSFTDVMDDDGLGQKSIPIQCAITRTADKLLLDFTGTANQVAGNINCPLSVTAAAVFYCFYCLMPPQTPPCHGCFRNIEIRVPEHNLLNASFPAAVAAGNVETSTRIVDVILGALAETLPEQIPAASHGSMNNIAMGSRTWDYYETIGGGMGASKQENGLDAVQTHMTNTLNTPIEVLEKYYPLRIREYAIRPSSGGTGKYSGGNGLIRCYQFLEPCQVTILSERRLYPPWGLAGGQPGQCGENRFNQEILPAKCHIHARTNDQLEILTAGGGGWGSR